MKNLFTPIHPLLRKYGWGLLLVIFLIGTICLGFGPGLKGSFIWDDYFLIVDNHIIKSLEFLPQVFHEDFFASCKEENKIGYWRPIVTLSYMVDYALWKTNPQGYHLTNLILHFLVCLAVYLLSLALIDKNGALAAALLFAVLPVHVENVAWISGRTDLWCALFYFISLRAYLARGRLAYSISLLAWGLAIMSKEMAVTLPLLILLTDYIIISQGNVTASLKNWPRWLPFFVILAGYFILRFVVLKVNVSPGTHHNLTPLDAILTFLRIFPWYIYSLIWGGEYRPYILMPISGGNDPIVWLVLLIISIGLALTWRQLHLKTLRGWLVLGFLTAMAPLSNLLPISAPPDILFSAAERFLYIPSFFFCLTVGAGWAWLARHRQYGRIIAIFLLSITIIFYLVQDRTRSKFYLNSVAFYRQAFKVAPNSSTINTNLGIVLMETGQLTEAEKHLQAALRLTSQDARVYNNLAYLEITRGQFKKAEAYLTQALTINPQLTGAYNNLGTIRFQQGRLIEAKQAFRQAIKFRPGYGRAWFNLGNTLLQMEDIRAAEEAYRQALNYRSDHPPTYIKLAGIFQTTGRAEEALAFYQKAIILQPNLRDYRYLLAVCLFQLQRYPAAGEQAEIAWKLNPRSAETAFLCGSIAMTTSDWPKAEYFLNQARGLKPGWPPPTIALAAIYLQNADRKSEGLTLLKEVLARYPQDPQAQELARQYRLKLAKPLRPNR